MATTDRVPVQARSARTRQSLIDALEVLLLEKDFEAITVSEIAAKAGVSTGAIYRRFEDKRDLLRAAFEQFQERTAGRNVAREEALRDLPDIEVIRYVVEGVLDYSLEYLALMRAATTLDDAPSFERMRLARSEVADWLAQRLVSVPLDPAETERRVRFALRTVTAVIRDTFLAGPGAQAVADGNTESRDRISEALVADLTTLVASYLHIDTAATSSSQR